MKNVIYYHAYLDDLYTWPQIFAEQMRAAEQSGLLKNTEILKITAITQPDQRAEIFKNFCTLYPVNIELQFVKNIHSNDQQMIDGWAKIFDKNVPMIGETLTHSKMWKDSQNDDFNILYIHMKGITATLNNLLVPGRVSKYKNRYDWRQFMNWGVLTEWQKCVTSLSENDVAGVDFLEKPGKHFSGNFWWTKAQHVRQLPNPETKEWWTECKIKMNDEWMNRVYDRFADEQWVCYKDGVKTFNLASNNGHYVSNDI